MERPVGVGAREATGLWLEWERAGLRLRLPLNRPLVIGRDPSSNVCLADPTVSRRHAVVSLVAGQPFVDATSSTNGITLDRGRASQVALSLGQVFQIGDATFRVVSAPAPPTALVVQPFGPSQAAPRRVPGASPAGRATALPAIAVGLVAVLAIGAVLGVAVMHPFGAGAAPSSGRVASAPIATPGAWTVSRDALPSDAPPGLAAAIASFEPPAPEFGSGFVVETTRAQGDWAIAFGHAVAGPSDSNIPTETIVVIAHRTATGWTTVSDRDDGFCASLSQLPAGIMDATESSFYGCS
jgi:hypothetical protein